MVTLLVNNDETTDRNLETKFKSAMNTAKQYSNHFIAIYLFKFFNAKMTFLCFRYKYY